MSTEDVALIVVGLWVLGFRLDRKTATSGCGCGGSAAEAKTTDRKTIELRSTETKAANATPAADSELVGYELGMTTGGWVGAMSGAGGGY